MGAELAGETETDFSLAEKKMLVYAKA